MKTCRTCTETKLLTEFCRNSRYPDGWVSQCKTCENRAKVERAARRRTEFFAGKSCIDCGRTEPEIDLQLDHVDPATKHPKLKESGEATRNVWFWAEPARSNELALCVPRCTDCHGDKTTAYRENVREGLDNGKATVPFEVIQEIRRRYASGEGLRALANEYGFKLITVESWAYQRTRKFS